MYCPFCEINLEKTRILEDKKFTQVILSNPRLMPGHLLVIPKKHVEKISELNKEERYELFETAIEYQEKILDKVASGCDIKQNYRPFQKQDGLKVNHLHIHIQPRELFDDLYKRCQIFEKDVWQNLSNKELERMIKIFKHNNL